MHIHCLQHDHFEDLGYIGDWAFENHFSASVTRLDLNQELPQNTDYDWLVVMGGKMGVNDSDEFPWLIEEIKFIRQAIDMGKIVIGVCLGSQMVAAALGAKVYKNTEPEMGFWPVKFSPEASNDSVFSHFPCELDVLHVHFDTFTLPENAINMAWSPITGCQAFRYRNNVFAFQFHFEVTPENVSGFITEITPEIKEGRYSQTPEEMVGLSGCCAGNNRIFRKVLDAIYTIKKK